LHKGGQVFPEGTAPRHIVKAFASQGGKRLLEVHQIFSDHTLQITRSLSGGGHLVTTEQLPGPAKTNLVTEV
jgi:hypothetical protein